MNKNTLFLAILFAINLCSWKAIGANYELTVGYGQKHEITPEPGHNEY